MGGGSSKDEESNEPVLVIAEWSDADWSDFPYMVGLNTWAGPTSGFNCGGSIISLDGNTGKAVALTAAHCVDDLTDSLFVRVGCTRSDCSDGGVTYEAERWLMHPNYTPDQEPGDDEDIALIFLKTAIDFHGATAVQLHPSMNIISKGDRIRQLGYGGSRGGEDCIGCSDLDTLEYHWTHFVPTWMCWWSWPTEITGGEDFCTEDWDRSDGKVTTCGGDSGSPAVYKNVQIGLVSRGATDCDPDVPSLMTSVPHYYDWINGECPGCLLYEDTYTSEWYGGSSGYAPYSVKASTGGWVKSIKVYYSSTSINGLQLQYSNGLWSGFYGSASGTVVVHQGGEACFSSVKVSAGSEIDGLRFTLSDGTKSPQFGGENTESYQESGKIWGYCISGLAMKISSTSIHGMQFLFTRIDMDDVEQAFQLEQAAESEAEQQTEQHRIVISIICLALAFVSLCAVMITYCVYRKRKQRSVVQEFNGLNEMKNALIDKDTGDEQEIEVEVEVDAGM